MGVEGDTVSDTGKLTFCSGRHTLSNRVISKLEMYHMRSWGVELHSQGYRCYTTYCSVILLPL